MAQERLLNKLTMGAPRQTYCKHGHEMEIYRKITKTGHSYCGECKREWERGENGHRSYLKSLANGAYRKARLKRSYDISIEDFDLILQKQCNSCAICKTTEWGSQGPCIDHDHDRNIVRGILCNTCNIGLGMFKDSISNLAKAIQYVEGFNVQTPT